MEIGKSYWESPNGKYKVLVRKFAGEFGFHVMRWALKRNGNFDLVSSEKLPKYVLAQIEEMKERLEIKIKNDEWRKREVAAVEEVVVEETAIEVEEKTEIDAMSLVSTKKLDIYKDGDDFIMKRTNQFGTPFISRHSERSLVEALIYFERFQDLNEYEVTVSGELMAIVPDAFKPEDHTGIKPTVIYYCQVCAKEFKNNEIVYFIPIDNNIVCNHCASESNAEAQPRIYKE